MSDFFKDVLPHISAFGVPIAAAVVGLIMRRPAITASIIFLWYGVIHLFVNLAVCTYDLTDSPSSSPGTSPRPDTSEGINGWAMKQVTGFFTWSWIAFVTATVVASLAIVSEFKTSLQPTLKSLSFIYPKGMLAQFLLLGVGITGIVFNSVTTKHTDECNSREFDWMAQHNYIPIVSFLAGLILLFIGLSPIAKERVKKIYGRMRVSAASRQPLRVSAASRQPLGGPNPF